MVIGRVIRRGADAGARERRGAAISGRRLRLAERRRSESVRVRVADGHGELVGQVPAAAPAAVARGGRVEAAGLLPGPRGGRGGRAVEVDGLARGGGGGDGGGALLGLGGPRPQLVGPPARHGHRRTRARIIRTAEAACSRGAEGGGEEGGARERASEEGAG